MKRKSLPAEPVIDQEILRSAKLALESDKLARTTKCAVCSAPCAPTSTEGLCWVCRRLKISAWRDSDQQAAQE